MARSLKEILKRRVLKELSKRAVTTDTAGEAWEEALPERFRGHARAAVYKRRVLEGVVDSPSVLAELEGFHRHEIAEKLKAGFSSRGLVPPVRVKYTVEEHA